MAHGADSVRNYQIDAGCVVGMKFAPGAWRYAILPLLAAPFALLFSVFTSFLSLLAGVAVLAFFRDPERTPPLSGVVSPADGKVSVLRREDGQIRLGIFMNVHNVHVVRAPFSGQVSDVEHIPGANRPAFSKDSDRNERVHVRFADEDAVDGGAGDRTVTFIAGAFARRIHPYVKAGDTVTRGERIGHIAFGSRVDVRFPSSVDPTDIVVERGERVTAGETIILDDSTETGLPNADGEFDPVVDAGEDDSRRDDLMS